VTIEREGRGEVPPEVEHELEIGVVQDLVSVLRGGGEFQSRRIAVRLPGDGLRI
jgi:hypothetical protein